MSNKKPLQIAFDKRTGSHVGSINRYSNKDHVTFITNYKFKDTLKYIHTYRGRSSVKLYFVSVYDGRVYQMFFSEFEKVLKEEVISAGAMTGTFTFIKKGSDYSITMIEHEEIMTAKPTLPPTPPPSITIMGRTLNLSVCEGWSYNCYVDKNPDRTSDFYVSHTEKDGEFYADRVCREVMNNVTGVNLKEFKTTEL